jgi:hypothetical protein
VRRMVQILTAAALLLPLLPASASAQLISGLEVDVLDPEGSVSMQAGSHPFAMRTSLGINSHEEPGGTFVDAAIRNLEFHIPEGFAGSPTPVPRCATIDFLLRVENIPQCADATAVGVLRATLGGLGEVKEVGPFAVFNLEPSPGVAQKLGFWVDKVPITVETGLSTAPPYNVLAKLTNISQVIEVLDSTLTLWGNPADPAHDPLRGRCAGSGGGATGESCPANIPVRPFITLPRSCEGPLLTTVTAISWWSGTTASPGPPIFEQASDETDDGLEPPTPIGPIGCGELGFAPRIEAQPTTDQAESPTGLDVSIDIDDEGLLNPSGRAHSDIKKAVVTLPEGVTANPSVAEGLATCSPQDLAEETLASEPGQGCPQASKVGTLEVETPLLEGRLLRGSLFIATQDDPATATPGAENPFDSLLALYMVIEDPGLGILVKLAGRVEPDTRTGQLITTFGDPGAADPGFRTIPQLPVSHFRLRLREGGRSPLISPPGCGKFTTVAEFTPWANPGKQLITTSSFQITRGVGGGVCPPAGPPPFAPGFEAGSLIADAGAHTPFYMRLTRRDGDQDMTRFSSVLPPGLTGKLAGIGRCPDAAIAAAKTKTGRQELASPSCPEDSRIGRVLGGAGVGSQLTHVPGSLYLGGPVGRAPLSAVAIVPAVAGPFDAGTVVVREALTLNPITAEVEVDGASSDPIPHIMQGIPLKVRDLRVYVDRPNFVLNPTGCKRSSVRATLFGSFLDLFSPGDDVPVALSAPFRAANCLELGFKPRLSIALNGGTRRGAHPASRSVLRPRPGDANLAEAAVRLPRSAFLDQAHIRTICTRVQFAADACPGGAVYGHVEVLTPLLEEPLKGPIYLRSSSNKLPDMVFDLHGLVDFEASARVDSIKGGIRLTFKNVPDAPISKVIAGFQGGAKGLIVNSRNLCAAPSHATVGLRAHNTKHRNLRPLVRPKGCGNQGPGHRR